VAAVAGGLWLLLTLELAWARLRPGPWTLEEVTTMLVTSVVLPFAATLTALVGRWRLRRRLRPRPAPPPGVRSTATPAAASAAPPPAAGAREPIAAWCPHVPWAPELVLFDRDGTLIVDVPGNRDPRLVMPLPGARQALDRLRAAGVRLAVVSNQEAVAAGRITAQDLAALQTEIERALGRFSAWFVCPHAARDGCACRKPAPGMILRALRELGVAPDRCALVGDIGADVAAARAAGVRAILVPTPATRREEIGAAPEVARDLLGAVDLLLRRSP
jgi:histidinol-phosphate phosphatase family protein